MRPVGRTELLACVGARLDGGGSVVLTGVAGIGKSTVLAAAAAPIADSGARVLRCSPAFADAGLPFLALSDLLDSVPERLFDRLPAGVRGALDAALLRGAVPALQPQPLAVRLGVRDLLRGMAAHRPVVLVIDDLQWVDPDSVQVLAYALGRMRGSPVRVLAAERVATAGGSSRLRSVLPEDTTEVSVGPLDEEALVTLLREHSDRLIRRPLALEIHRATEGNPLFALEIAAAVTRHGRPPAAGMPLPVPEPLRDLLGQRLATVPATARATLLTAAAAARPTLTLLERTGHPGAGRDLAEAERCGVARLLDDGSVAFSHPLMQAVVYREALVAQRLAAHARLAEVAVDPVQRARHLAAAHPVEDEAVACALMTAAELARRRGAPGIAAELAELAAERTPAGGGEVWAERKLAAAAHAEDAGRYAEAHVAAEAVLAAEVPARVRMRAKLVRLQQLGQGILQAPELVDEVLVETASDPALSARARLYSAYRYRTGGQYAKAAVEARRAVDEARVAADAATEIMALEALLTMQRLTGDARYPDTLASALAREAACPDASGVKWLIRLEEARFRAVADSPARARDCLAAALPLVEHQCDPTGVAYVLKHLLYVEIRLGRCGSALQIAARLRRMAEDGDEEYLGPQLAARACAELYGRSPGQAQRLAEQGLDESQRIADSTHAFVNLYMLGAARLFTADVDGAIQALHQARSIAIAMGVVDHAYFPWPVDLAEALVAAGRLTEARSVIEEVRPAAQRLGRQALLAGLDRSTAVLLAAEGGHDDAVRLLESLLNAYRGLSLPLEQARTLVILAVVQRRRRRRATAATLLRQARDICQAAEAAPWLERIEAELRRTGGVRGAHDSGVLTPVEARIVTMIIGGATNREIAVALSISVKTVEGAISRIYRKLDVRSRVELVRRQAAVSR